jgi:hypothetical protein
MFRASTDGGKTFGDKINLSNTPGSISDNAELLHQEIMCMSHGGNIIVLKHSMTMNQLWELAMTMAKHLEKR